MPSIREDCEDEEFYLHQGWAPPLYDHDVGSLLDEILPHRWIGQGFIVYPLRSPDLTPLDSFYWDA